MPRAKKAPGIFKALPGYKANYATLLRAAEHGDLCGMEATEKATGKKVALLCAVNRVDGQFEMAPLARLLDGNPYDDFVPCGGINEVG